MGCCTRTRQYNSTNLHYGPTAAAFQTVTNKLKTPMITNPTHAFDTAVKGRSDRLMNFFLPLYFITGIGLTGFYGTWLIAVGVGGISLIGYYSVKLFLPDSLLYQYVLSTIFGIFMAQFIYQMHGLFEMHFFAFIGSALLIT